VRAIRDLPERLRTGRVRRPKVSVEVIAYNQAQFIAQAIDSVLNQKASFEWEIVVGDDYSTDGTREILKSYAGRYPERIQLLLRPQRLGPHRPGLEGKNNFLATYRACRGEYVALLDGDDYWTDNRKLEKQVEFLQEHPNCSLCCHPVTVEYSGDREQHWNRVIGESQKETCTLEDILRLETKPEMPTPSMMIRRRSLRRFPAWFDDVFNGDYAIQVLLAERGDVGFLPDSMAVHRKHAGGVSRVYDTDPVFCNAMLLKLHVALNEHLGYRFRSIFDPYIEQEQQMAAAAAARALAWSDDPTETPVRLALDEFVPHPGYGRLVPGTDGRAAIVTHPTAWAYAATLRLPTDEVDGEDRPAYACIRARSEGGTIGIGVLHRNGDRFIDRYSLEPSEGDSEVRLGIPRVNEASDLVVLTWDRAESATVHIESIHLVVFAKSSMAAGSP
jgi:glycosyltransferase involved in cell wall biosynthesis